MRTLIGVVLLLLLCSIAQGQTVASSLQEAFTIAQQENKYVFIYCTFEGCSPCKIFEQQTLVKPEIRQLLKNYVVIEVNTENNKNEWENIRWYFRERTRLISSFNYQAQYTPSYFVFSVKSRHAIRWGHGVRTPSQFRYWLQTNS